MTRIIAVSGSLRRGSFNTALLRAAVGMAPAGTEIVEATIRGIPLYDGDVEAAGGIPPPVTALKEAIVAADGVLMVTPEYNNSIPGVLKNGIDWMSRPPADIKKVFGGRPVALIGASDGGFGTTLSQVAWLPVLRTLGTRPWFGAKLLVSKAQNLVDADGNLRDEKTLESLRKFLAGFVAFVEAEKP